MPGNIYKVLVVEDEESLLNILADRLNTYNYEVYKATDGEQALSLILELKPHIVLLDLLLPKMDGFKMLEKLRHYPDNSIKHIPVIVLSNLWSNKDILAAQALKIEEYYVKANTNLEEVYKRVGEILKQAKNK